MLGLVVAAATILSCVFAGAPYFGWTSGDSGGASGGGHVVPDPTPMNRSAGFDLRRCVQPGGAYGYVAQEIGATYAQMFSQRCSATSGPPASGQIRMQWLYYSKKSTNPGGNARNDHLQVVEDTLGVPSMTACLRKVIESHIDNGLPTDQNFDVDCSFGVWIK